MLSVLIPTYNYDITPLVHEIYQQALSCNIIFEILVYDDGSKSPLNKKNQLINELEFCSFKELEHNIGRSAIRNLLGADATYDTLLFIDAGTFPKDINYIKNYLNFVNKSVVVGGMTNLEVPPLKPYKLRWVYTQKRESQQTNRTVIRPIICSSKFLIKKVLLLNYKFDETIHKYGTEDVLFFDKLIQNSIPIDYFDNPVIHDAKDDTNTFIQKTEEALENLIHLIQVNKIKKDRYRVSRLFYQLEAIKFTFVIIGLYWLFRPLLVYNFNSSRPSIMLYDFYRLGYFCQLSHKK
jgi:hypothetical protein